MLTFTIASFEMLGKCYSVVCRLKLLVYLHAGASATVRLAGGSSKREGRLEVYHDGVWGTVCDDDFNDAAARVACNSLGFG